MPHQHEFSMKDEPFLSGQSPANALLCHRGLGNAAVIIVSSGHRYFEVAV